MTRSISVVSMLLTLGGCATISSARRAGWESDAAPATAALQQARFDEAAALARDALAKDPRNSRAHAVAAVSGLRIAAHDLIGSAVSLAGSFIASASLHGNFLSMDLVDGPLAKAEEKLAAVDQHLREAAKDPEVSLDLCLACWQVDWNRNGEIDDRDQRLFEIEVDAQGEPLPPNDPRRRPTFHLDLADVHWLLAAVSFMRAGVQVATAYDWTVIAPTIMGSSASPDDETLRIPLRDAQRMKRAGAFISAGLAESLACRQAALDETDDLREWMPNPRQKDHPLPLEVDDALYETWDVVVTDAQRLMSNSDALSVSELVQLGRHQSDDPARGYLMLGKLFSEPRDLVIPLGRYGRIERASSRELEQLLQLSFGQAYLADATPSGVTSHLRRMKGEVDHGRDSFDRKLRYLLWIN